MPKICANLVVKLKNLTLPTIIGKMKSLRGEVVPISSKEMQKLFLDAGYEIVPGGKGSHWKLKKKGCPTVIIPNHKELKPGTEHSLRKLLAQNKKEKS